VVGIVTMLGRSRLWLRLVFLLLGSALAVSVTLLDATLAILATRVLPGWPGTVTAVALVLALPVLLAALPALRQVEGVSAESLLGVSFVDGTPGPAHAWGERVRAVTFLVLHVAAGAGFVAVLFAGLPAVVSRTAPTWPWALAPVAGIGLAVLAAVLMVDLLARAAPRLLGPSHAERLERLERQSARLLERDRLARELHDSVGHALSVVALQAGAARRTLGGGTAYVGAALASIETTARSAASELDHMLGLLREEPRAEEQPTTRLPGLEELPAVVRATELAGLEVRLVVRGRLTDVPGVVSREAFRITQEGLTNALRHASGGPVDVLVERRPDRLAVLVVNPTSAAGRPDRAGRGLVGMAERVEALGGSVHHAVTDGMWRLVAEMPLPASRWSAASTTHPRRPEPPRGGRTP
jgi:signal transduction histidine kinase